MNCPLRKNENFSELNENIQSSGGYSFSIGTINPCILDEVILESFHNYVSFPYPSL